MQIRTLQETERGCGFRQPGGFYLRQEKSRGFGCGLLPIPILTCSCCGFIEQQTRSAKWMMTSYLKTLAQKSPCVKKDHKESMCSSCPIESNSPEAVYSKKQIALDWVGVSGYGKSIDFLREADQVGISRRVAIQVDKEGNITNTFLKGFKVGHDWIALAHPKGCSSIGENAEPSLSPAIIAIYKPNKLQYVKKKTDTNTFLKKLHNQGVEIVDVKNVAHQQQTII